jgi:hypothetical protein
MSLPMIGRLLGHTQVQTTHRYAHLFDDPLRAGLQQVDRLLRPKLHLIEISPANVEQSDPMSERLGVRLLAHPMRDRQIRLPALPKSEARSEYWFSSPGFALASTASDYRSQSELSAALIMVSRYPAGAP